MVNEETNRSNQRNMMKKATGNFGLDFVYEKTYQAIKL